MYLGYNTNGLAHHEPLQALELLAEVGYQGVALTIDHYLLNPWAENWQDQLRRIGRALNRLGLASVIETGARFLLDPRHKHEPTLISPDAEARRRRVEFLQHAVRVAAELGSQCVSLWSGRLHPGEDQTAAWDHLLAGLEQVLAFARRHGVVLAFEPEPGMLVATLEDYARLKQRLPDPRLRLTMDVGHVFCQQEGPLPELAARYAPELANVHIEDMRRGVHEHLMFGQGEMDFPPLLQALARCGYRGGLYVELSRHSHMAPEAVLQSHRFLAPLVQAALNESGSG